MHLACRLTVDLSMTGEYLPAECKFQLSRRVQTILCGRFQRNQGKLLGCLVFWTEPIMVGCGHLIFLRFSLFDTTGFSIEICQIFTARRHFRVVRAEGILVDRK